MRFDVGAQKQIKSPNAILRSGLSALPIGLTAMLDLVPSCVHATPAAFLEAADVSFRTRLCAAGSPPAEQGVHQRPRESN